jgi:hypothetical protein
MPRLPRNDFVFEPGCFAELLRKVQDVLCEADDCDTASPAGLLEEIISARYEVLKLVLPEEDEVRGFFDLSPQPCSLKGQFYDDLHQAGGLEAVFQERKIDDDDFALVRRHLRRNGAFATAENAIEGIEQKLVRHPGPSHFEGETGTFVKMQATSGK